MDVELGGREIVPDNRIERSVSALWHKYDVLEISFLIAWA